jgi:hypothetical protein
VSAPILIHFSHEMRPLPIAADRRGDQLNSSAQILAQALSFSGTEVVILRARLQLLQ